MTTYKIIKAVSKAFNVPRWRFTDAKRGSPNIAQARQVAMVLTDELTENLQRETASAFNRTKTAVIGARKAVQNAMDTEPKFCKIMDQLRKQLTEEGSK